jgi:hypothetical protein
MRVNIFAGLNACTFLLFLLLFSCCVSAPTLKTTPASFNDTAWLQTLLDSPDAETIIPAGDRPWETDPLVLVASNKTIIFSEGCTIRARRGSFLSAGDTLLSVKNSSNVVLAGYGAVLEMNRRDYRKKPYKKGEWRHGIALYQCRNVIIEGLCIRKTGGDGVYIGQNRGEAVCENIVLRNLVLLNNYRQGVSVISAKNFLMEGCMVSGTSGTPPAAGIDFEPNTGLYGFTGCIIRNCSFIDNSGAGIQIYLKKMKPENIPVEIRIEQTVSRKNFASLAVYSVPKGIRGSVCVTGCDFSWFKWIRVPSSFSVVYE